MVDETLQLLLGAAHPGDNSLWCLGEGTGTFIPSLKRLQNTTVCTNRFDLFQRARQCGLAAEFSDWQFPAQPFDAIFLRLMKEKPVNQHLLNCAWHNLTGNGRVILSGRKDEGIKSFVAQLEPSFCALRPLTKSGNAYFIELIKKSSALPFASVDYPRMEIIAEINGRPIWSKPGVYGWQKVDQGSKMLVDTLLDLNLYASNQSILDLGCGYGYLTLAGGLYGGGQITATDNNAAALACTAHNAREHGMHVEVVASDCGDTVQTRFDRVVCNPPFHAAFNVDGALTDAFLRAAKEHLTPQGAAFFVTNSFIPIEKKATPYFTGIKTLKQNRQFKVLELRP